MNKEMVLNVILTFYYLLLSSSGEAPCLTRCVAHLIPRVNRLCCCNVPIPGMKKLLLITKICVLQFAVQKPIVSTLKVILVQINEEWYEGPAKYCLRIYGLISMFVALWTLLFFFRCISKTVVAVRPVQIFLWIKVAMFLNLLQEFIIGLVIARSEGITNYLNMFSGLNLRAVQLFTFSNIISFTRIMISHNNKRSNNRRIHNNYLPLHVDKHT